MRVRYRRAAPAFEFPGFFRWRRHLRLQQERILAPLRILTILAGGLIWLMSPHAASTQVRDALSVATAYAVLLFALLRLRPRWTGRLHFAVPFLDFLLVILWVRITGGPSSIFSPLFFLGASSAAILLSGGEGLAFAVAYSVAYAVVVHPPGMFGPIALLISGLGLSAWSALGQRDRIAHLRDPLTGSFNRAYGLDHLRDLLTARAFPFAIGLVDLDLFKQINDMHGHATGDRALRECVRAIQSRLRADDLLVRLGGDEFLIIWPGLDVTEATAAAERVREAAEQVVVPVASSPDPLRMTLSIGVAQARRGMRPTELLSSADRSLYRAKLERNRVARI